jgi:hypothetical protein
MPVMAAGLVTPSSAQVRLTVLGVAPTGTGTLLPQLDVQLPQLLGPPAESVVGLVLPESLTDTSMPAEPPSPATGPALLLSERRAGFRCGREDHSQSRTVLRRRSDSGDGTSRRPGERSGGRRDRELSSVLRRFRMP